jgi:hypothetical protein
MLIAQPAISNNAHHLGLNLLFRYPRSSALISDEKIIPPVSPPPAALSAAPPE